MHERVNSSSMSLYINKTMAEGLTIHQSLKKHPSSGNNANLRKKKNAKLFRKL